MNWSLHTGIQELGGAASPQPPPLCPAQAQEAEAKPNSGLVTGREVIAAEHSLFRILVETARTCLSWQDPPPKVLYAPVPLETSPIILGTPALNTDILVVGWVEGGAGEHVSSILYQWPMIGYVCIYTGMYMYVYIRVHICVHTHTMCVYILHILHWQAGLASTHLAIHCAHHPTAAQFHLGPWTV